MAAAAAPGVASASGREGVISERPNAGVLDFPRDQFARIDIKLDRLGDAMIDLKVRVASLEAETGHLRIAVAEVDGRLDREDTGLDRIEHRLELRDSAVA